MKTEHIKLLSPAPGCHRELLVYRFAEGVETLPDGPRKVYLQAGLHGDEWPGLLVLQHLLVKLREADTAQQLRCEFVVVPYANPIGLSQNVFGYVAGRFDLVGTGNFNRNFPDLTGEVVAAVKGALGKDQAKNDQLVRAALREAVQEAVVEDEAAYLKSALLSLSIDADYIFDLHCDDRTSLHLYAVDVQREAALNLSERLRIPYLLTESLGGVVAFDGTHLLPWQGIRETYPKQPVGGPKLAVTVEYRGQTDVEDELAAQDAERLFDYFKDIGAIAQEVAPAEEFTVQVSPLDAVDVVKAPVTGLLIFRAGLDDKIAKGEIFAEIVRLDSEQPNHRTPVYARTSGYLMGLSHRRMVRPGDQIAKIAGKDSLSHRNAGNLLQL